MPSDASNGGKKPKLVAGCPKCEFIVETCRTTTLGGCGDHDKEDK